MRRFQSVTFAPSVNPASHLAGASGGGALRLGLLVAWFAGVAIWSAVAGALYAFL